VKQTFRIEGLAALDRALAELPKATAKGVLRRAGTKAMQIMADEAIRLAPDDPNTQAPHDLKSSIKVSSKQKSGRQTQRAPEGKGNVRIYMGPTKDGYPQAIPQEFGAVQHGPNPYMRPAFETKKIDVLESLATDLGDELMKTAARIRARTARTGG
jgi:HK97 gp10 family phage protein